MNRVLLGLILMLITESAMAKSLLPQLRWYVINDSVMGGQSNSKLSLIEDDIYFTGQLSLANNGGFASIRAQLLLGMGEAQRIAIKVKGEPRTYQFRLRTNDNMDGIAYKVEFETQGSKRWQTLSFSPLDFTASYRGRAVANAPKLQFANVSQLGFLIADKNLAPFSLLIDEIATTPLLNSQ